MRFSLMLGSLRSATDDPVGLPGRIVVERDMDTPVDALRLWLGQETGVSPGASAEVALGYNDLDTVFTGTVSAVRRTLTGTEVWALGTALALVRLRVSAGYERRDAGSIVHDLAERAGIETGTIDPGSVLPSYAVDIAVSAHAHMRALADRFGFELYTDRLGRLMFHEPGALSATDYTYGRDLLGVAGRVRAAAPLPVVGGESPASEGGENTAHWLTIEDLTGRASGGPGTLVLDPVARTQDLADRFAAGYATVRRRARRTVRVRVLGNPRAELGERVGATGELPAGLAGSGYVRALRHEFDPHTGWITELTLGKLCET